MAKAKTVTVVRITDLEKEFGLPGRTIRQVLRKVGLKAPETGIEGFGPRARYEWTEGSEELKKVRSILQKYSRRTSKTQQEVELEERDEELEQEELEDDEEEDD